VGPVKQVAQHKLSLLVVSTETSTVESYMSGKGRLQSINR